MKRNDVEFCMNMLSEIMGNETEFCLLVKNKEMTGCGYKIDYHTLAKTIFDIMHREDGAAEFLTKTMLELGYNLMKHTTDPSKRFVNAIFDAIEERDDYEI